MRSANLHAGQIGVVAEAADAHLEQLGRDKITARDGTVWTRTAAGGSDIAVTVTSGDCCSILLQFLPRA